MNEEIEDKQTSGSEMAEARRENGLSDEVRTVPGRYRPACRIAEGIHRDVATGAREREREKGGLSVVSRSIRVLDMPTFLLRWVQRRAGSSEMSVLGDWMGWKTNPMLEHALSPRLER